MIVLAYPRIANLINGAGTPCFVGDPPDNVPVPYCFVWGPVPTGSARTIAGSDRNADSEIHVQVVAKQAPDVLMLASEIADLLDGAQLDVAGWRVAPLKVVGSTNVQTARQVPNEASNTYPAWLTLHVRLRATKTKEMPDGTD